MIAPSGGVYVNLDVFKANDVNSFINTNHCFIPEGESSAQYSINVPINEPSQLYNIMYSVGTELDGCGWKGFYSLGGTLTSDKHATGIDVSSADASGMHRELQMILIQL